MKTSEQETFCPYPGLRSFTEEESLYFKGREEQVDQVSELLQQNKFLMVTGASGEGKSSLIYAGLVPNARAGFFKARYTNWLIADFRPERTPLRNMAAAISASLVKESASVETELRRGFSSLVDLYKNSRFYVEGKELSLPEKRQAANLLVIVDQFEEFFTNPENYFNEAASVESQTVVNLALETARLAQRDNLPIYVVCTMRSDYIGQCSAFRGLPEFIGYSQFFVPRLKRKDLIQVIEEPALLSGNRITRRLVERLVYDLADGIDQLPILQHALSQIWHAADQGHAEMDLVHYAQVGGMPAAELPDNQRAAFGEWFDKLSEGRQQSFGQTGLNRVIEIHADRLYENSREAFQSSHPDHPITEKDARFILALTFACLTRIDHSRAVRNRMTLREITAIINKPHLDETIVAEVIRPYRLEENAFVRPFATGEYSKIASDTVLDISHESLIRNWGRLKKWADQEFEYYTTLQDFKKQMERWKEHGKSPGFLLPIGPLSYYENWIAKSKPNPHWINRYSERKDDPQAALRESRVLFTDMQQFVAASARKVWLTRAWMKYGTARMAAFAAGIVLLIMSVFYVFDANRKRNSAVVAEIRRLGTERLQSDALNAGQKMQFMAMVDRMEPGSFFKEFSLIANRRERIGILVQFLREAAFVDRGYAIPFRNQVVDSLIAELGSFKTAGAEPAFALTQTNYLLSMLIQEDYYHPQIGLGPRIQSLIAGIPAEVEWFYQDVSRYTSGVSTDLNYALQLWMSLSQPDASEIQKFIDRVSPFGASPSPVFQTYYRLEIEERNGRFPIRNGGGYHLLASFYAATGQTEGIIRSFEAMKSDPNYFTGSLFNNYNQIIGFLYKFGHRDKVPAVLSWLAANFPTNVPRSVLRNTVIRAGYRFKLYYGNFVPDAFRGHQGYAHPVLWLLNRSVYQQMCEDFMAEIQKASDSNERNHLMAMQLKRQAVMTHKYNYDRGLPQDTTQLNQWLDQAWMYYSKVSKDYLEETATLNYPYWGDGIRNHQWPRKWFFIYPDYMDGWFADTYHSDLFFRHADRNGWISKYYQTETDYNLLHYWVSNAHIFHFDYNDIANYTELPLATLERVIDLAANQKEFDTNLIALVLANRYFEKGDTVNGLKFTRLYRPGQFLKSVSKYEYIEKTWLTNLIMQLTANLAVNGKTDEARGIAESLHRPIDKFYAYWYASLRLYQHDYDPNSFAFLDSAQSKVQGLVAEELNDALDFRDELLQSYGMIGGSALNARSLELIRDLPDGFGKLGGRIAHSTGRIREDNYFEALSAMPANLTDQQEMIYFTNMLEQICLSREKRSDDNRWAFLHRYSEPHIFFYPN